MNVQRDVVVDQIKKSFNLAFCFQLGVQSIEKINMTEIFFVGSASALLSLLKDH